MRLQGMPLKPEDFSRLYAAQAPALLRFFVRRTLAPEVAVDLVAETFAVAFEDRARFRGHGDDEAGRWLYAIGRRCLADFFRHKDIEQRAYRRLGIRLRPLTEDEFDRIEQLAATEELRDAIGQAYSQLSDLEREVLELRIVQSLPYAEVASSLGITEDAARARGSRALRRLRQSMTSDSTVEECHVF